MRAQGQQIPKFATLKSSSELNISPTTVSGHGVHGTLRFGPFELSRTKRLLRRDGVTLPLGSRAFDILVYLAERPGEVVRTKELADHVWPDIIVAEGTLRVHMATIRMALRDGQFGDRYIANIKGRGYSFIASVAGLEDSAEQVSDQPDARLDPVLNASYGDDLPAP